MKKYILFILIFISVGFTKNLDTINVKAKKNQEKFLFKNDLFKTSSTVTVINEKIFKERTLELSEILNYTPSVNLKKYGGLDDYTSISIRGSNPNQVSIILDGIELNSALYGGMNLSEISLDQISEIEVFRGNVSGNISYQAMGGIINIKTKKIKMINDKNFIFEIGSFNSKKYIFDFNYKMNNIIIYNLLSYKKTNGDFNFKNNNNTMYNNLDNFYEKRKNNHIKKFNYLLKINWNNFKIFNNISYNNKGIPRTPEAPNKSGIVDYIAKLISLKNIFSINYKYKINKMKFAYIYSKDNFYDPNAEIGYRKTDNYDKFNIFHFSDYLEYKQINNHILSLNLKLEKIYYSPEDKLAATSLNYKSNRKKIVLGFNDNFRLSNKMILYSNLRYIRINDSINAIDYSFGNYIGFMDKKNDKLSKSIGFKYAINSNLFFKSNYGKFYRFPTFYEMFGNKGFTLGNSDLSPENSNNFDCSFIFNKKINYIKLNLELGYFKNKYNDMILWLVHTNTIKAMNLMNSEVSGYEFIYSVGLPKIFINGNLTIQNAKNKSATLYYYNKELPGNPKYNFKTNLIYLIKKYKFFADYNYLSSCYTDTINTIKIKSRNIMNVGLAWKNKNYELTFEIKNLTDNTVNDNFNYPLPGRMYFLKSKFTF